MFISFTLVDFWTLWWWIGNTSWIWSSIQHCQTLGTNWLIYFKHGVPIDHHAYGMSMVQDPMTTMHVEAPFVHDSNSIHVGNFKCTSISNLSYLNANQRWVSGWSIFNFKKANQINILSSTWKVHCNELSWQLLENIPLIKINGEPNLLA
jgi:hypothetical protein